MSLLADRRTCMRYEVVGILRGTLEMSESVRVHNISSDGALIETSTAVPVGTTQSIQMSVVGQSTRLISRVRHVTTIGQGPAARYAVGLEFVSAPAALKASVATLLGETSAD